MRHFLLLCFFLLVKLSAVSQSTETEYFDATFRTLPDKEGAVYIRTIQYENSAKSSKVVATNYISGEKYTAFKSVKTDKGYYLYEGPFQKWHKNGQLFYHTQYQNGRKEGESLGYYPSGKLKRRETYAFDKLVKGECFKEDGTATDYFPHEVPAEFPGGLVMMNTFIKRNLKYPADALRGGKEGSVLLQLSFDETGKLVRTEFLRHVFPSIDAEALRVVQEMPDFKPAQEEGVVKAFSFHLPISFNYMSGPSRPANGSFSPYKNSAQPANR